MAAIITITVQELKECQSKAQEASIGRNCYYFYKKRDELYAQLLQEKTAHAGIRFAPDGGDLTSIQFSLDGGDLIYGERVPDHNPPTRRKIRNEEGFRAEEYTSLTGRVLPHYDNGHRFDEFEGKIYAFAPNGNISVQRGAPQFGTKTLIQEVWTESNIAVVIE